ncbi:hypothetical protein F0562_007273 [Nyssa sinensis]|uniref:Uncharacterized protein n=1 Tax=Nyssa sinensis TaxID=561372 RepID=A0A5J5A5H5_9ASTE|nr:hypothetical protein F0562_007273 [Nyssa sinensis]
MGDIELASAETAIQDYAGNAEIEMENSALNDTENQYNGLVNHIAGMLEGVKSTSSSEHCIFRVPITVRKIKEAAYTPRIVSIGPFHHGSERLQSMEVHKLCYFKKLIKRGGVKLEDYVRLVKEQEQKIHRCYSEIYSNKLPLSGDDFAQTYSNKLPPSGDDFLTMILVDAGFIIELLLRSKFYELGDKNDYLFNDWLLNELDNDLILLENQLPFFILDALFNLTFASVPDKFPCLLELALDFFHDANKQNRLPDFEVCHFTDLIRTLYLPTSSERLPSRTGEEFKFLHTATELHEAGVKFKVGSSKCLLDIKFSKGELEIPCFIIEDTTIPYIRNLMALELCLYPHDSYIIDYIIFMDYLINTREDVDLLVQNKILVNRLGDSGAAATFFNYLSTEIRVRLQNFYFSSLCEDLSAYYKEPRHKWKATLKRDYFSTPWRIASTTAAIILLVLTFIQTQSNKETMLILLLVTVVYLSPVKRKLTDGNIDPASAEIEMQDSAEIVTKSRALIDIEDPYNALASHIAGMLEGVQSTPSMEHCIYRVPMEVRKIDEEAHTPRVVSVGPFHHGSERLQSMEAPKLIYFKKLIERGNMRLEDYVGLIKQQEEKIRHCYAETIGLNSDKFVTMILVDAGFIIELLLRSYFGDLREQNEPLLSKPWLIMDIVYDLILLENQLPFFVLGALFNLTSAPVPNNFPSLLHLTLHFFEDFNNQKRVPNSRARILVNDLGDSDAAAALFNKLCAHITFSLSFFYYSHLCEDLNAYYKVPWHKWKATFRRDYFSTPWRTASTIAAVIFLVLTSVQTTGDIESASAKTAIQDSAGNAEIEMENSALNDIENQYNRLVNHISGMVEGMKSTSSSELCIFRLPITVQKINEAAYTPRLVSIGPFHHGSGRLQSMEAQKLCYFKKLIEREDVRLEDYVRLVKEQEQRIHRCYSEIYSNKLPLSEDDFAETSSNKLPLSGDDFLTMILIDAGFIIELLLRTNFCELSDENDYLFNDSLFNDLHHDFILLENQLPFFFLDALFNLTFASVPGKFPTLLELALDFFHYANKQNRQPNFKLCHFTDLIRTLYLPTSERPPRTREEFQFLHTAIELHEAGVKFKVGSSTCLLDIKFSKGVLEIPCFKIEDRTIPYIRNLMALELCLYPRDSYIIDYIVFMDYLINTPKDIDLLVQKGILEHWLGDSGAAATFFNSLCTEITMSLENFYFSSPCVDLNAYYKVPRHKWKATLKREYFNSPWRTASTTAAIILLVLTFIQTICSILPLKGV